MPKITRVYAKKYPENEIKPDAKVYTTTDDNWMIETDFMGLRKILQVEMVNYLTTPNYIIEVKEILGIEAARKSTIK